MKVLIIEDEKPAAHRLESLLGQTHLPIEVVAVLDTVSASVDWISTQTPPDLIFMDIQLADDLSFEIFKKTKVKSPVIFTTAYDQYAIRAFKVNSVDYLLKPIDPAELQRAMNKYEEIYATDKVALPDIQHLQQSIQRLTHKHKNRFVIKVGEHIKTVSVEEVSHFRSREKVTYLYTKHGRHHILDSSLDQLENSLDPEKFFRINRQYIVAVDAIQDIITYSSSRLRLVLHLSDDTGMLVSRERVTAFKQWLDQ